MIHLFLNALAASAGAGVTYVRNVLPHLSSRFDVQTTVALDPSLQQDFVHLPRISFVSLPDGITARQRFWREQTQLPGLIRRSGAHVLISAGNFALRNSPISQILLSGNSLYTSRDFFRDLLRRVDFMGWLDTRAKGIFARRSVAWADCTVAPSHAFADELRRWTKGKVVAVHHGFDANIFFADTSPLSPEIAQALHRSHGNVRLLFVSHYNYYRNFETLLRALPILEATPGGPKFKVMLTCKLRAGENPGSYDASSAAALIQTLGVGHLVEQLGAVPYRSLHYLYRACDVYVTPAYTETFAHPLVEAMASGLPVIASDIAVHREICGQAALYFDRWSPEELAKTILQVVRSEDLARSLRTSGETRSHDFSWAAHTEQILEIARRLRSGSNC